TCIVPSLLRRFGRQVEHCNYPHRTPPPRHLLHSSGTEHQTSPSQSSSSGSSGSPSGSASSRLFPVSARPRELALRSMARSIGLRRPPTNTVSLKRDNRAARVDLSPIGGALSPFSITSVFARQSTKGL